MEVQEIASLFTEAGGQFRIPPAEFAQKLGKIRAYIFDWDGVFNDGTKRDNQGSSFNEPDSMGINLLRFSHYLRHGSLAYTAIITSEANASSHFLAQREDFSALYFKATNKAKSFAHFLAAHSLAADEVAFVFDDVLDLAVAEQCGLRIAVHRRANPLFNRYLQRHNLADYLSVGQPYAIREVCELLIGLHGNDETTFTERKDLSPRYLGYMAERKKQKTAVWTGAGEMSVTVADARDH
jgi:3-deoxy-D-manno-octulosonate 8-phosphate phosphatase (KDO 8-P phosphatase)